LIEPGTSPAIKDRRFLRHLQQDDGVSEEDTAEPEHHRVAV